MLASLTPREQAVLSLRFGWRMDAPARWRSWPGVQRHPGAVRQIEAKALRKLRHPSRAKRLRDYLEE